MDIICFIPVGATMTRGMKGILGNVTGLEVILINYIN
jgi:hypothetical protein